MASRSVITYSLAAGFMVLGAGCTPGAWSGIDQLVAVVQPTTQGGSARGVARFISVPGGVKVVADIEGLKPGQLHGFHIHQFGDATDAKLGKSAGGHYNPEGHKHAMPSIAMRHAGDMGNLKADAKGKAHLEIIIENVSLMGMTNPIIGRGVIVHAKKDDGGGATGNAGARIGIGVIGIAKP